MSSLRKIFPIATVLITIGAILLTLFTFISFMFMFLFAVFGTIFIFSMMAYIMNAFGLIKIDNENKKINIGKERQSQEDRIEILKEKFVNGEISEEELEKRLDSEFDNKSKDLSKEFNRMI